MEPARKIEKLLRAFARKRRAEAGEPLQLHPATRRLLQEEIARRAPKTDEEDSVSLWQLVRQQWAFLFGFALIMFCLATLFLPALSSAKRKAQNISAMNNLKEIGLAAQMAAAEANGRLPATLDALTNQLGSAKVLIDPQSGKPFVYVAAGQNLDTLPTNEVLAYAPEGKNGRAVLLADGSVVYASREQFSELTNRATLELALRAASEPNHSAALAKEISTSDLAKIPVAAPVAPEAPLAKDEIAPSAPVVAPPANKDSFQSGSLATQMFAQKPSAGAPAGAQNFFKNNVLSTKTASVLANFQMEQNGDSLRVVDGDGSVYEGTWQVANAVAQKTQADGLPTQAPPGGAGIPQQTFAQRQNSADNGGQMLALNYSFQVTGTNLSLKKAVVFTGNLTIVSGTTASGQNSNGDNAFANNQSEKAPQQNQANLSQQIIWSNARITGTAVVGETNQIEINAAPQ